MKCLINMFVIIILGSQAFSQNWPQWRGTNRDGHVKDFEVPKTWPNELSKIWSVKVGAGISSPIVKDGRVYLLTREGDDETALCLNLKNGEVVWRQSYVSPFYANPQASSKRLFPASRGNGPFATPIVYNDRLYTLGVDRILSCFDANTGKINWQNHYFKTEGPKETVYECPPCGCSEDDKTFEAPGTCSACQMEYGVMGFETSAVQVGNYYGAVCSPIIVGDLGVVHVGNGEQGTMIAFDLESGKTKWEWKGPAMASSSPVFVELHNTRQLVTMTRLSVVGVSAQNGELLWTFPLESNAQIITPVLFEDIIIFATYRGPTIAIRPSKNENTWSVKEVWKNTDMTVWTSSFVLDGPDLYGFFYSKRGQFGSIDARTGEVIWTSEGRQGLAAAMLDIGDHLMAIRNDGQLFVLAKGDSFHSLVRYSVAESPTWAHPVIWGTNILIKDESNLTLWQL